MKNSVVEDVLKQLEQCSSKQNRCDLLLDHSEIDYLLEYINNLEFRIKKVSDKVTNYTTLNELRIRKELINDLKGVKADDDELY